MSTEQLKRLAIGLLIVLAVWGGLSVLRSSEDDAVESFRPPRGDSAAVTAVVIAKPGDTISLARSEGGWTVNGFAAAANEVNQLLGGLADTAGAGEVVAESPASHSRFGVDSASARRVTVRAGDKILSSYLVGNRGSSFGTVYLRRDNDNRVYQMKSGLAEAANRELDDWRDKRILSLAADSIAGVDVRRGRTSYSLARTDAGWRLGKAPADSAAVARLLTDLGNVAASGFPTPAQTDSANFARPERALRVRGKAGQVLAELAFDSLASAFLVRQEGKETVYRMDPWAADQVTPTDSALRAP